MIANFSWKKANRTRGIVPNRGASRTPENMKYVEGSPMRPAPPRSSPNAILKPTTIHNTLITPIATKLWSIVEIMFLVSIMPP
jgi:hypothetical protein